MASQVDASKWFELTEDSDSDDECQPKRHMACHSVDCDYDPKTSLRLSDATLSQHTLEQSQSFDSFGDKSKHSKVWDPTLSQYTLGKSQLSMSSSNQDKMDTTGCKTVDVESLNLQFQTLLADDSQDEESTQLSSASDQQLGSSMDDPWKSTTEASEGASLSEYPLESLRLCLDDMGQSETKDNSDCEEVVNTAISEVSKNFITGNLSSYPLQCGDSDLSSDDQKVHQKSMEGKYPETAFGMSDSDWVTESDTNVSPRMEKSKTTESTFNSMSSFSPPLSSTVLTNMSVASAVQNHALSVIQEASVDNTASFKEMPKDLSTVSTSRGSFLGRDHETKYLDSINTKQSLSMPSLDSVKYVQDLKDHTNEILQDGGSRSQSAGAEFLSKLTERERRFDDKSLSSTSVSAKFKSSDAVPRTEGALSSMDDGQLQYAPSHVEVQRMGLSQDRVRYGLDNLPSTVDLARKSEMILDRTLSKLNLAGSGEGRHSFPLSGHSSVAGDEYKRHSLGRLESNLHAAPKSYSRQEELVKTLSGSTQSYQSDDLTRSIKSLSSEGSSSAASDEVARLMARSGSSADTTMSRGDESDAKDGCPESTKINLTHEGRRSEPSQEECGVESRVSKVLAETAYINTYSSDAYENRSSNYSTHSLPLPKENTQMTANNVSLPPPPPPPVDPQSVSSDLPLPPPPPPPPPQGEELSASLDYRRLHQDLQEIQNSLQNNLDFADSGNESVQSNDVDREREVRTPVGSETGSEIVPSTTNTPEQSRRLLWDYGADIACAGNQTGRFTSRDTDATETDSEDHPRSYVDRAQVAQNAAKRQSYNSEGEETHTSGSSNTKAEDAAPAQGTDDEQTSGMGTPTNRSVDNILCSFRAQRSLIEAQYLTGMASQVSQILEGQDPHKQAHGILDQVNSQEQELLTRLANRPPLDSSFTDTSLNASNRSIVLTDSDVRKRLEMSGLSSPDRSRTFGHASFTEFSTPKKINNPFAAFSNAKSFLSNQLQEMSNKTFDHSIELRTPLRRVVECYPLYGFSKDTENKSASSNPAQSDSRMDTKQVLSTESVHSRGGRGRPEGVSPEEFPSAPDLTSTTTSSHSLTERRLASSMERNVSERDVIADRPWSGTEYGQTSGSVQRDSPESSPIESDLSGGQRKDKLRPYRPTGSRDLYYTESDTGSMADSVTTMESTHTGSDDATAPYFPPHVLGTRGDAGTQPPISRKYQQPGIHMEPSLSTIEEKSVSDERDKIPMETSCTGLEKVGSRDVRSEKSLDQMRPSSPRDTLSKTSTRSALEIDSGVGTKSNFTTATMTDTLQLRERRNQMEPMDDDRRHMDSVDYGSRSDQLVKDGTYSANLKVLDTRDGQGSDRRIESRSQSQFEEERSRSDENLPWTSSGNSENPQSHAVEGRSQSQVSDRQSGSGLKFGGTPSGSQIDDRRAALPSESRTSQDLESRSRQSGSHSTGHGNGRNAYDSQSGNTEARRSSDNVLSNGRQVSEQYVEYRSTVRDVPDRDYNDGRLRSRSDGDLIDRQPRSASAARDGQLPEPPASPIHPHSTLRDSTMRSDPRHSTAIDTSTDHRNSMGRFQDNHIPMEEDQGQSSQGSSLRSGRDGRQRSSDRKDTRQRMEQNRNSRRGQVDVSSSEDDGHRAIDRAPVSRPAQLLRETLEQEADPAVPVDINLLWQRFQELNQTDSDTSLNTTRMETLAQLLRNPAKHLVKSYFEDQEKQRKTREEKTSEEREKRRSQRRSQRSISESEINGSFSEVMVKGSPEKKAKTSSVRKMNKKNAGERTQEGVENLYSIPEDMSFDQRRYKKMDSLIDPNMEKLREKIRRQKEKIEREQRKELKRMEKLVKLEQLLSAKKKGKISESTLMDQLEYISTTSAPTDSMEDMTESTLTMSGANSEILTDDSTTAKDSSIEMQMIKFARNQPPEGKHDAGFGEYLQTVQRDIDKNGKSKKAEKVRTNQKLKEQSKNRADKSMRSSMDRSVNETESLYDFREVDIQIQERPRHVDFPPDSNRRARSTSRGWTRDAATNYPSPLSRSPVSPHRHKQKRTKSEGIQTTPNLQRYASKSRSPSPGRRPKQVQMSAPFAMREKTSRSQSPPYSRCFTPESMGTQHSRQKKKKLPASPKGIAWYVEVKDPRPWRQPLRERQEYAVKQAWVAPGSKSQWQTAQPQGIMEEEDEENQGYQETVVDRIQQQDLQSKLIEEEYTFKKSQSLQDAFRQNMQKFISQSRERQKRMTLAADHRRMQEELRLEREKIFPVQRKHGTNLDVHPYSEHLYQPKRRVFTRQEQKDHTQRIYKRLPEVMRREEDRKRENQYRLNRLKSKVFTKRVQRHILIKAGKY
ncbi:serine-rich adhesin for platelets-like [Haliotis asinina]|uniref:serine-rich adhesin for platelets-like n=1 Tax=Haliotis asinina TaxID=109174 RepID=UPI0035322446